jgi:hypothetical protein
MGHEAANCNIKLAVSGIIQIFLDLWSFIF